ncbi:MAG: response regulator transcription factor [bacterium]|nr:response regulator transcription factor [bacterium]
MQDNKKIIYIVDDEKDIREILEINLSGEGYMPVSFPSAEEALKSLDTERPDLILLDIMMGGMDGYEFCKNVRSSPEHKNIPIIFLSAKTGEFDKVLGLELGGDDYISKPFGIKELLSRVKAVLRRAGTQKEDITAKEEEVLTYKGVELFPQKYGVKVDSEDIKLTRTEFELLHLFLKYPDKIFSRDNIIDSIRGDDVYVVDRTIDVHVMNIRKKLGKYKNIITTFSGIGYGIKK